MPEQLLSRRTVFGWLAILAALTSIDADHTGMRELVDTVTFPIAVIDLREGRVLAMSARMRALVRVDPAMGDCMDLHTLLENLANLTELLNLLRDGSIDGYQALRRLKGDERPLQAWSWVSVSEHCTRQQALWVIAPVGEDAGRYLAEPSPTAWPDRVSGIVVGTLEPEWRIERVSIDAAPILGYRPPDVVGSSLVELVHPDDVGALVSGAAHSVVDRAAVGIGLRLRRASGEWLQAQVILTLLAGRTVRFGFALAVPARPEVTEPMRVTELERRLWRIAREVEDAGIAAGFDAVPDERALPALGGLAPRQGEVLSRLLRGERVPTIAEHMYVSQSTVRNHLAEIYRRLGVHSQHELLELVRATSRAHARQRSGGPPAPATETEGAE